MPHQEKNAPAVALTTDRGHDAVFGSTLETSGNPTVPQHDGITLACTIDQSDGNYEFIFKDQAHRLVAVGLLEDDHIRVWLEWPFRDQARVDAMPTLLEWVKQNIQPFTSRLRLSWDPTYDGSGDDLEEC